MSRDVAEAVYELPSIVINNTFRLSPWSDVLYAADSEWWANTPDAYKFEGLKVSITGASGTLNLWNAGLKGYTDDKDALHTYGNSGAQAIQIAAKAGAKRILLCGFDMRPGHWHKEHATPLRTTPKETYQRWVERYPVLAAALAERGVDVVNCTPGSALTCFRFAPLGEVLEQERASMSV